MYRPADEALEGRNWRTEMTDTNPTCEKCRETVRDDGRIHTANENYPGAPRTTHNYLWGACGCDDCLWYQELHGPSDWVWKLHEEVD